MVHGEFGEHCGQVRLVGGLVCSASLVLLVLTSVLLATTGSVVRSGWLLLRPR